MDYLISYIPSLCRPNIISAINLLSLTVLFTILQNLVRVYYPNLYNVYDDLLGKYDINGAMLVASITVGILGIICSVALRQLGDLVLYGILLGISLLIVGLILVAVFFKDKKKDKSD